MSLETLVQSVPIATFDQLAAGDVLFIDSSHVSKIGSDVNHLFFDVLPAGSGLLLRSLLDGGRLSVLGKGQQG